MKKTTYLLIFLLASLTLGAYSNKKGFWDGKSNQYSNLKREPYVRPEQIDVTLVIEYSDDNIVIHETKADGGDSVFNLLRTVAAKENIELEVKEYDFGTIVEAVNGVENTNEKSWIYFVNDKSGDVAADQKTFENGDTIQWRYIEPTF